MVRVYFCSCVFGTRSLIPSEMTFLSSLVCVLYAKREIIVPSFSLLFMGYS